MKQFIKLTLQADGSEILIRSSLVTQVRASAGGSELWLLNVTLHCMDCCAFAAASNGQVDIRILDNVCAGGKANHGRSGGFAGAGLSDDY